MLKIGFATREYTPPRPALIQGQMHVRIGCSAMDPLTVTAMAIEGRDSAILISCDLTGMTDGLLARVRQLLAQRDPTAPVGVLTMSATHTHCAPVIEDGWYQHPGGDLMTAAECMELLATRAAEAAAEAWQGRKPRNLGRAFGHAVVGHNRRACYADGSALMYGAVNRPDFVWVEGFEDHSLDMLLTYDPDGSLAGIVLVIPCPSQVDEHLSVWTADYWHDIRQELRRRWGSHLAVVGLCGAAGDQSPHFLLYDRQEKEMLARRGVSERQAIAQRVADAVARDLPATGPMVGDATLKCATRTVPLTAIRINKKQRDWSAAEYERCVKDKWDLKGWWPTRLRDVRMTFDTGKPLPPAMVELHALRLGDMALLTTPFELFIDYALRIKSRSPAAQTAVVQLTNGRGLYLPTSRALAGGHYSAMPAVCRVGSEGGGELVEHSLAMIGELFAK